MKTLTVAFLLVTAASLAAQSEPSIDITTPIAPVELNEPLAPGAPSLLGPDVSLPITQPAAPPAPADEGIVARETVAADAAAIEGLKKLSPEERSRYALLLTEASKLVQGIRIQEAMERILEAEAMFPDYFALQNLKGAAFTKVRDFEKATAAFKRSLELNPDSLEAGFNLAEMSFVTKNYAQALEEFSAILERSPRLPAPTRNLLRYKIYLCTLALDRTGEADKLLETFHYMSDTPEYYYANSAKEFHAGDKEEARSWLQSASRIYDKQLQDLFVDSLVEMGWIETL